MRRNIIPVLSCIFLLIAVLWPYKTIFPQETILRGRAEGMPEKLVRLIVYVDQFSKLEHTVASTYTDSQGNFEMRTELPETTFAYLALQLKKGEFYLKPGATYTFHIPYDTAVRRGSVFDELPLGFTFEATDGGLNRMIGEFNASYNQFILSNTNRIYRSRDKQLVSDFARSLQDKYSEAGQDYLREYMKYTIASLEWVSKIKDEQEIIENYFSTGDPILYQNIQYTSFFSEFFKAMFGSTHLFSYDEMTAAINSEKGYERVDQLLKRSGKLAENEELRQLVAMVLIAKKYYSPDSKKYKVLAIFEELKNNSRFEMIRHIAGDYPKKLTHLDYGSPAPLFRLPDASGAAISLSLYKGQFVLLNFNRADCPVCLHYMSELDALSKEFKGDLQIISLVEESGFREMAEFMEEREYEWPVLNIGKHILTLEDYNVRAFPAYIIINPDNTIATANAPFPEEGLGFFIRRFMSQYQRIKEGRQ